MKAALVTAPGTTPIFAEFSEPIPLEGSECITVHTAALSPLTKSRAAGSHYSADNLYPFVPSVDGVGVTSEGRRVYFFMPKAPFGAMAERTLVDTRHTVSVPENLSDVAAAALANPGVSCWAALMERARFQQGETVLINGATGSSGILAVQIAKHLGAKKIIVTGRNVKELDALRSLGADIVIPFDLSPSHPEGVSVFEHALCEEVSKGLDIVIDYLWGTSARTIIVAIAKAVEDAHPIRFVQVGEASREQVELPGTALRSSCLQIMGSGLKSVPFPRLLVAVANTFALAAQSGLHLPTQSVPLSTIAETWDAAGKPRLVYTMN